MDLQKNFVSESLFQRVVLGLMTILALFTLWNGIQVIGNVQSVLYDEPVTQKEQNTFEIGPLLLSKTSIDGETERYVTITDLAYTPSAERQEQILKSSTSTSRMLGLRSQPSVKLNENHLGFWTSQFYLEIALRVGGWLIILFFFIGMTITNFRQEKKLFTPAIYRWFLGLYFLIFAGFMAKAILYGRLMYFLNREFYFQEPLTGGISTGILSGLILLFFLILFLQKAIPMQKEQDLTI